MLRGMPTTFESEKVVGQAMALSTRVVVDGGLHRQSLEEAMRSLTSGSPERPLLVTSMEGTTVCLNLDLFLHYSPQLRSLLKISSSHISFLPQSPHHLFLPETSLSSLMALQSLLCQGISKTGELDEVLETAKQLGIKIGDLVVGANKIGVARKEVDREKVKKISNSRGLLNDDIQAKVNRVCTNPLPDDASVGENGIRQKQKLTVDAAAGSDMETGLLKQVPSLLPTLLTAAQQAMDRVMNAGAPSAASALLLDTAGKETQPAIAPTLGGVVSVEVYGAEEEEEEKEKRSTVEVKSEPEEVELGAAAALSEDIAAVAPPVNNANIAVASSASVASSEKRKESPASALPDEVKLKKKKLLDVVLQNLSEKKSAAGGKGINNVVKQSKLKRKASDSSSKASDTSGKAAIKAVKKEEYKAVSQKGKKGSISSTTGQQVKNGGVTKTIKSVGENTAVNIASPSLISNKVGGATSDAARRKSEPSSTSQTSLSAKGKVQVSKLSTQGKNKAKKADSSGLNSSQSKKVYAAGSSMENLNQMPGLTISPNPNNAALLQPTTSSNQPSLPAPSPGAPALAVVDHKPSDDSSAAISNQTEAGSKVGEFEKIPQKVGVQVGEDEKGCNYSLICELCQKEHKTLQSLYTHVIVHIRLELERKVKDLMEGLQCKVCDQVFKAKAPLLTHIGCTHGKVNDILKEKGYNVLPCLLATNGKKGAEMQANLIQIKKEKVNIMAE